MSDFSTFQGMSSAQRYRDPEAEKRLNQLAGLSPDGQPLPAPAPEAPIDTSLLPPADPSLVPDLPAERDWQAEMNKAREQSDRVRMLSQFGRIGSNLVQSTSNPKRTPDLSFYDDLDKQAATPEARVREDMALDKLAKAAREEREKRDPNSAYNRKVREMFAATAPHVAKLLGDRFNALTEGDLERSFKTHMDSAKMQREREQLDEVKRHNLAGDARANYEATNKLMGGGFQMGVQQAIDERQGRTEAISYTKRTKQLTDVLSKMESLNRIAPNLIKGTVADVPAGASYGELDNAFRKLPAGIGFHLTNQQAQEVKAHVKYIFENMARIAAGANFTESEQKFYDDLFGNGVGAPPEYQAKMLNMVRTSIANHLWHDAADLRAYWPDLYKRALQSGAVGWEHPLLRDVPVDRLEGDELPQPPPATKFSGTPGGGPNAALTPAVTGTKTGPVSPQKPTPNAKGEYTEGGKLYKVHPQTGETRVWDGRKWVPLSQGSK